MVSLENFVAKCNWQVNKAKLYRSKKGDEKRLSKM